MILAGVELKRPSAKTHSGEQFGTAYIQGLQGRISQWRHGTGSILSSFLFARRNELRASAPGQPGTLGHLPSAIQAAIRDGKLAAMMNAYPQLDGEVVQHHAAF